MSGARIELKGHEEAIAALSATIARLDKPAPLYDAIGAMLVTSTIKRFETETDPEGNAWPKSARALADGGKTLTDSTHLRGSITHEADDKGLRVGTNVIYAAIHQFGGTIVPKTAGALRFMVGGELVTVQSVTMPKRAFLGLNDEDESAITELAQAWIFDPAESAATVSNSGGVNA